MKPIGENVDGNCFDAGTGLAISANGDGTLIVVCETSPDKFEIAESFKMKCGSRTMAIGPKTYNI